MENESRFATLMVELMGAKCGHRHAESIEALACAKAISPSWRVARAKLVVMERDK